MQAAPLYHSPKQEWIRLSCPLACFISAGQCSILIPHCNQKKYSGKFQALTADWLLKEQEMQHRGNHTQTMAGLQRLWLPVFFFFPPQHVSIWKRSFIHISQKHILEESIFTGRMFWQLPRCRCSIIVFQLTNLCQKVRLLSRNEPSWKSIHISMSWGLTASFTP